MLARPLAAGEVVRAADVIIERRPKAEFAANIMTNVDQAVGMAARRRDAAGRGAAPDRPGEAELVARNDSVTITFEVPGITLTMRGKALEGGAQGDTINVLNVQSKRPIQGNDRRTGPCHRDRDDAGERHAGDDGAAPRRPDHRPFEFRQRPNLAPAPSERHDSCIEVAAHSIRSAHAGNHDARFSAQTNGQAHGADVWSRARWRCC